MSEPAASPTFARRLGPFDAAMIVVSGIIGSGIFVNPYVVAGLVRTPALILGVWIAGGAIALAGAFVFAELATVVPRVGGQYAFFREAFHPLAAFLHGWSLLWIIQSGATAAVAVAFAQYVVRLGGLGAAGAASSVPLAVAILLALGLFHALGIKPGSVLLNVVTFTKTLALGALIVAAFLLAPHSSIVWEPVVPPDLGGWRLASAFLAALAPAMFAYGGWQSLNYVAEEVRAPERNLPRAILGGVACVIAVYLGANLAYLHVLGAPALAASRTPAADAAARLFGEVGGRAVSVLIVVSTFGFLNLSLLSAPRVYYAMAADGLFFRRLATLSPRFRAPTAAILLQAGLAALLASLGAYERLLNYAVFADWIFFALAGVSLFALRRKLPDAARPFAAPGYPWVPLLFTLAGVAIVLNLFVADPRNALFATLVIAAGVPVYFLWRWLGRVRRD
ncbi:MAG TPA: amino acid permease [Thermoanaerobaculia bacterium]|nr:amino acid permease [Thermoanaerobaculia bacterium]